MSCIRRTVCQNKKVAVGVTVGALYLGYSALGKYTDETPTQGSSVKVCYFYNPLSFSFFFFSLSKKKIKLMKKTKKLPADPGENLLENSQGIFFYFLSEKRKKE